MIDPAPNTSTPNTAGFPDSDIFVGGPRPDKMNIVVRLHGRGKAKPVLFNAHLDVVEAIRETWSVEPFVLTEKDGFFYGRGTIDVKNEVAIWAINLIRLRQEGFRPDGLWGRRAQLVAAAR